MNANIFAVKDYDCIEDSAIANSYREYVQKPTEQSSTWKSPEIQETDKFVNIFHEIVQINDEEMPSKWHDDEDETNIKVVNQPENLTSTTNTREVDLYDFSKSYDENFENGGNKKYILIEVDRMKSANIINPTDNFLPTPQSKCLIDFDKVEEYSSLEFGLIDYDTLFGTRFTTFIKYNSDFFTCDERILFEAILIKFKAFGYRPFYWSREVIFNEVGIKKDRATKIISRFVELGIISTEVRKSMVGNRPQQITYYTPNSDGIIELIPEIFKGRDDIQVIERDLNKYLLPSRKSGILQ